MKTIYFLDWLSQESGFSVPELVKEIKNELWLSISIQELIDKSIKNGSVNNLIDYLFDLNVSPTYNITEVIFAIKAPLLKDIITPNFSGSIASLAP